MHYPMSSSLKDNWLLLTSKDGSAAAFHIALHPSNMWILIPEFCTFMTERTIFNGQTHIA